MDRLRDNAYIYFYQYLRDDVYRKPCLNIKMWFFLCSRFAQRQAIQIATYDPIISGVWIPLTNISSSLDLFTIDANIIGF